MARAVRSGAGLRHPSKGVDWLSSCWRKQESRWRLVKVWPVANPSCLIRKAVSKRHSLEQRLEPGIRSESIKHRIHIEVDQLVGPGFVAFLEPFESAVTLTQTSIYDRDSDISHVPAMKLPKLPYNLTSFFALAAHRVKITRSGQHIGRSSQELGRFLILRPGCTEHF